MQPPCFVRKKALQKSCCLEGGTIFLMAFAAGGYGFCRSCWRYSVGLRPSLRRKDWEK